jgi:hypothetical protein
LDIREAGMSGVDNVRFARTGRRKELPVHLAETSQAPTLARFVERPKKYRGAPLKVKRFKMRFPSKHISPFDEDER